VLVKGHPVENSQSFPRVRVRVRVRVRGLYTKANIKANRLETNGNVIIIIKSVIVTFIYN
jgi:hypothetical protein